MFRKQEEEDIYLYVYILSRFFQDFQAMMKQKLRNIFVFFLNIKKKKILEEIFVGVCCPQEQKKGDELVLFFFLDSDLNKACVVLRIKKETP